jgi:hypothetical protein
MLHNITATSGAHRTAADGAYVSVFDADLLVVCIVLIAVLLLQIKYVSGRYATLAL